MKVLQQKIELMRFLLSLFWMCNAILLTLLGRCLIENNILPSADNGLVLVQTGKYYSSGVDWSQVLFEIIHQGKDAISFMLFDTLFVGKCSLRVGWYTFYALSASHLFYLANASPFICIPLICTLVGHYCL